VQQLANFIVDNRRDLQFVIPTMKIQRSDPLEFRQRILPLSPAERKRLDINKPKLWYQKQKLMQAKIIKF
jgi:hypothetical protein